MFSPLIDQVPSTHFLPLMGACHSVLVPGTQRHFCENAHFENSTLKEKIFSFLDTYCIYCPRIPNPLGVSPKSHSTQQREDNFTEQLSAGTARMWDLPRIREVISDRFRAESTFSWHTMDAAEHG